MRAMVDRKDEQQARRMTDPGGIESLGPRPPRARGQDGLGRRARKGAAEATRQALNDLIKAHETPYFAGIQAPGPGDP
jgi:hypothetical protein